ncbi:MAG: integrase [Hyphomicrobium sp.]|nr:MAG: integrase [Hyphomicrobium sp.]
MAEALMSNRTLNRLTATKVRSPNLKPGEYPDGGGLILIVDPGLTRRWLLRMTINGQRVKRGLGGFPAVSLEEARERAAELRKGAKEGRDVVAEEKRSSPQGANLRQAFATFWELKAASLSNGKHAAQWGTTLETYVFPVLGNRPVETITADDVIRNFAPIWRTKNETASRTLQRLRAVIESHQIRVNSERALPWRGILKELNGSLSKADRRVQHFRALPFADVPAFYARLCERPAVSRFCLRWAILTAARSGEARGTVWTEIDLTGKLWSIPAERMKGRVPHRVPLSTAAMELLAEVQGLDLRSSDGLVFPGPSSGRALSDMTLTKLLRDLGVGDQATCHGFRSCFKDWAANERVDDRVSESCLAHQDENKVRRAYLRDDFLDQRRNAMEAWGIFLTSDKP